jgi:hydroxyethylthiazole kinase-like uncharacterized protein yjeF
MSSVGIDLVEIDRIKKAMENPRFLCRVLGKTEYSQLEMRGFSAQSVAASFSAKEAFSKAIGTGLCGFALHEVELIRLPNGKPEIKLSGNALEIARRKNLNFSVSVTHTKKYAAAVVIGEEAKNINSFNDEPNTMKNSLIKVTDLSDVKAMFKHRAADSNKGDYGRLLCVCGSEGMAGAAVMSAKAAIRCGCGIVDVALPKSIYPIVASQVIEPVFTLLDYQENGELSLVSKESLINAMNNATVCLLGCGLGKNKFLAELTFELTASSKIPLVIDADGINMIAENINVLKTAYAPVVLTPHPGEMARLLNTTVKDVQSNRMKYAKSFAEKYNVILVLKGSGTIIAQPDGTAQVNLTGNPGMAKGGSGDVLAGMIASFIAQGIEPARAAAGAVYLHGAAGDRCAEEYSQCAMLPTDLINKLPELFLEFER